MKITINERDIARMVTSATKSVLKESSLTGKRGRNGLSIMDRMREIVGPDRLIEDLAELAGRKQVMDLYRRYRQEAEDQEVYDNERDMAGNGFAQNSWTPLQDKAYPEMNQPDGFDYDFNKWNDDTKPLR